VNLRQAESYLLDLELFGMSFGLHRMHRLMDALGMPQRRFASIHVVGSNGKSSTARMIAAILERHGIATGTYTSPHLASFAERIEVGERPIDEYAFGAAVKRVARAASMIESTFEEGERITQFEALTAAAYGEFARRRVEVGVIEAGLGGRLDATNVLPSGVQVLTSVALEHTRWLGSSIAEIAAEKLDVVRGHGTLVVGELDPEAEEVAMRVARERSARLVHAPTEAEAPEHALGRFQRRNFAVARTAAEAFLGELDAAAVRRAADEVEMAGRMEVVAEDPLVVHDAAHNPAGAAALAESLPEVLGGREPVVGVVGVLDDKDARGILRALGGSFDRIVVTGSGHPRAVPPAELLATSEEVGGPPAEPVADPHDAVARARELAGRDGAVVVAGSIYLIADLVREESAVRASAL
jgi:dihydrofolate synthase / folylpolyglutamate synthase